MFSRQHQRATLEMKISACQGGATEGGGGAAGQQPLGSGWLTVLHRVCSQLAPVAGDLGDTIL